VGRFCTSCGERLEAEDRFCGECGAPVRDRASIPGTHEQWDRVFGADGPGEDVPPGSRRDSVLGPVALAFGAATPLLALLLNPIGLAVLFGGGTIGAIIGGAGISDASEGRGGRRQRDAAIAGLVLGLAWLLVAILVPALGGA
jgi:hypothetical protein